MASENLAATHTGQASKAVANNTSAGGKSLPAVPVLQRRVAIGDAMAAPAPADLADVNVNAIHSDATIRRFDNAGEMKAYAAGGNRREGMGTLADGTWVRLPSTMLVLGENHSARIAPGIIAATGITRFRYEGFVKNDAERLEKSIALEAHVDAHNAERMPVLAGRAAAADEADHSAEHALPKYARTIADVVELASRQASGALFDNEAVTAGSAMPPGHATTKTMIGVLHAALLHAQSYDGKLLSHPVKAFYKANKAAVDTAADILGVAFAHGVFPNFAALAITAKLGEMTTVYKGEARKNVGLDSDRKASSFQASLQYAAPTAITDEAKELDFLRDASMLKTIKEAKGTGDRLFVIGDAHRQKLRTLIAAEGLKVMKDSEFVAEQKALNEKVEMGPEGRAIRDILPQIKAVPRRPQVGEIVRLEPVVDTPGYTWSTDDGAVSTANPAEFRMLRSRATVRLTWAKSPGVNVELKKIEVGV